MDVRTGSWWDLAACRGLDATPFFAPAYFEKRAEKLAREAVAKATCRRCPVRVECLEHALATRDPHGVWGGMNEAERRAELRRRRASAGQLA
jgi:WhiB family redox-sensing transcriptional regulator